MKKYLRLILLIVFSFAINVTVKAQSCTPTAVTKSNSLKVYVHWMPWFFAPTNPGSGPTGYATNVNSQGSWGQHWTNVNSNFQNSNNFTTVTDYTGASVQTRNICAHSHPLIGPYDESDPNVLEYHLLLMKYSGIDGVIIDWYGSSNANSTVGDASANQVNSAAMIADVGNYGLKYALAIEASKMSGGGIGANLSFAASNYLSTANYIKLGDMRGGAAPNATAPLVLDFEPYSWANPGTWNTIGNTKALLTYYGQSYNSIPSVAGGEFMWPYPGAGQGIVNGVPAWYNEMNTYYNGSFYTGGAPNIHNNYNSNGTGIYNNVVLGIACPGFFDYYIGNAGSSTDPNAGCCDQYGIIPRNYNGNTLSTTLNLAKANQGVIDGIQISTWNDFSEGTVIEPTVEYGFSSLTTIQQFTGVPYTTHNLAEIYKLFTLRKTYSGNASIQTALNTASCDYASLDTAGAQSIIDCIATTGSAATCLCTTPTVTVPGNITVCNGGAVATTNYTSTPAGATYTWTNSNTAIGLAASGTGNINGFNATNNTASPITATISVTPANGSCIGAAKTYTITVNPDAVLSLTSAAGTTSQTPCINNAITNITYSVTGGGTGATVSGLPTGVNGSFSGSTFTISGTPTASGNFTYTVTTTGTCAQKSLSGTINVKANATLSLTSGSTAQTPCANSAITNIVYTIGGSAAGASVSGLPAGVSGTLSGSTYTISGTPTATGNFTYTVTTTGGCTSPSLTGTINVSSGATLTLTSGSTAQTPCINSAITNIVYTIGGSAAGASVSGLPAGVNGALSGNTYTISGTPTASGNFTYAVTTTGGCGSQNLTGTINVKATATLSLTSGSTAQTPCANSAITNIVYTIGGSATNASVSGLPAGVSGTLSGSTYTISGTPTATGNFTYTVTTTGGCTSPSLTGTINVSSGATLTLTSGSTAQTPCINAAITNIVYTIGGSATNANVSGLPAGVNGALSGSTYTISGTPTTSGNFTYTVTTTGGCGSQNLSGTLTVNPDATLSLTSGSTAQTVCINTAIGTIKYATGGGGTGATVTGLPAGVTGTYAAGVVTISGTPTTAVGSPFNYTVTTTGTCVQKNLSGTITVNAGAAIALSSAGATSSQTICINNAITPITYSITGGATGANVTGLPAGITASYSAGTETISGTPTTNAGSPYSYTVTTTGGCGSQNLSGTITVNPDATLTLTSAVGTTSQTVCINTAITNITYSIGGGATGATVTGLPAGVTSNFGAGVVTISGIPSVTSGSPFNYTVTTTGTCVQKTLSGTITVSPVSTLTLTSAGSTTSQTPCINSPITNITYTVGGVATGATITGLPPGVTGSYALGTVTISGSPTTLVGSPFNYTVTTTGGCSSQSLSGSITVKPDATITLSSSAATTSQSLCINTPSTNITYSIGGGGTGATVTGLPAGVTGSYAAGVFTISGTPTTTVGSPFNYTVTTTGTCTQKSLSGTITVNPVLTPTVSCGITTTTSVNFTWPAVTGATAYTISYTINGGGVISGGSITATTYTIISLTPGDNVTITVTPTAASGCFGAGTGNCTANNCIPPTVIVPANSNVCNGATIATTNFISIPAGGTFTWTNTNTSIGLAASGSGNINSFVVTNVTASPVTATIAVTPTVGACTGTASSYTITVNPDAVLALTSAAGTNTQTLCINTVITPVTYSVAGGGTGATVTGLPAGVTGSYAAGVFTISGSPTTIIGSPFNYTVTTTGTCAQKSLSGTITVNPNATLGLTSAAGTTAQTVCINTPITQITYSVGGGGTGATITGLPAGVTSSYAAGTVTISGTPTTATGSPFTYTVTTTGGACTQSTLNGTITVNPTLTPVVSCGVATPTSVSFNWPAVAGTTTYTITYTINGGAIQNGGSIAATTYTINALTSGDNVNITITPVGTGCYTPGTGTCTAANCSPSSVTIPADTVVCNNAIIPATNFVSTPGGATFSWTNSNTAIGLAASGNGDIGSFTVTNATTSPITATITVTPMIGVCSGTPNSYTITVNPTTTITLTSAPGTDNQTVNINNPITNITYAVTGATSASATGLPAGVTGNYAAGVLTISGTPTTTVGSPFTYTVSTTGGCGSGTLTGTITVNPVLSTTVSAGTATFTSVVFNWTTVAGATGYIITYTVNGGAVQSGGTTTGTTYTVSSFNPGDVVIITVTPTGPGTYIAGAATYTAMSCTTTITLTSGPATQTVFVNTAITSVVYTVGGVATNLVVTGLPTGVTGSFAGSTLTISGTPTATGTFNYTVTTTGPCTQQSLTGSIIVNAPSAPIVTTGTSTTTSVDFSWTTVTGATGYTITYTVNGGSVQSGGSVTGTTYTVTPLNPNDIVDITVTPTGTGTFTAGTGTGTANNCTPSTVNVPADTTICNGGTVNATSFSSTPTGATFSWTNSDPSIGLAASGTGDIPSFTAINITNAPVTATITVTPTIAPCTGTASTYTITVNPNTTITLTSAPGTDNQTVNINNPITNITYAITGATSASATGLPGGVTGNYAAGILTISGTPTTIVGSPFNYTVTTTGGCGSGILTGTITVLPLLSTTITPGASTPTSVSFNWTTVTGATGYTITYTINGGAVQSGGSVTGTTYAINSLNPNDIIDITVTPTGAGGFAPATGSATASTCNATITLTSAAGTAAQTVCINTAITTISYSITGATGANTTGLPLGVTANFTGGVLTISGTPTSGIGSPFNYTVTTTGGVCAQQTITGIIDVNPDATLALTSAAATTTQSVCINTAITNITYSIGGGGTGATVAGLPAGVTGSYAAGVFTISGTPNTTVGSPFNYTVTTTGTCVQQALSGVITVNPGATITLTSASNTSSQIVCINTSITNITYSIGGSGTGAAATGLPAGITGTYSGGIVTISGTPTTATGNPFNYTVTTTGTCAPQNLTGTITVNPTPLAPTSKGDQIACATSSSLPLIAEAIVPSGVNLVWYEQTAGGSIVNPVWSTIGSKTYYAEANAQSCVSTSRTAVQLTIINPPDVSVRETSVTTEAGYPVQLSGNVTRAPGDGVTYSWSPSTDINNINTEDPTVNPSVRTVYTLTASSTLLTTCSASATVDVIILDPVSAPNIFSPNGDGKNDTWYIQNIEQYPNAEIQVFNRYGQFMFQSEGNYLEKPWDGTNHGAPLPIGAYYYIIKLNSGHIAIDKPLTGSVSIIR